MLLGNIETSIKDLTLEFETWLPTGTAVIVYGDPGIGKTQAIEKYAHSIGAKLEVMVTSMMDRLDLGGMPIIVEENGFKATTFAPHQLIQELSKESNPDGKGVVLYLNEFIDCPEHVKCIFYRLIEERRIGGLTLRDNVYIIADGNLSGNGGSGKNLRWAEKGRFAHYAVVCPFEDWLRWAQSHGVNGFITSFLSQAGFRGHFNNFDPKKRERAAWACPRSWFKLSRVLPSVLERKDELSISRAVYSVIGEEAGAQFVAYLKNAEDLPNINEFINNPNTVEIPSRADLVSYLCGALLNSVFSNIKHLDSVMKISSRLKEVDMSEFSVFLVRSISNRAKSEMSTDSNRIMKLLLKNSSFKSLVSELTNDGILKDAIIASNK